MGKDITVKNVKNVSLDIDDFADHNADVNNTVVSAFIDIGLSVVMNKTREERNAVRSALIATDGRCLLLLLFCFQYLRVTTK